MSITSTFTFPPYASDEMHALGKAFHFNYGDLQSNRAGFLTHRQKAWLRWRWLWTTDWFAIGLALFFTIFFMALAWTFITESTVEHTASETGSILGLLLLPASILVYIVKRQYDKYRWHSQLATQGRVKRTVSDIRFVKFNSNGIKFQGIRFWIFLTEEQYDLLVPNIPYRIHYLPEIDLIVSLEPLPLPR